MQRGRHVRPFFLEVTMKRSSFTQHPRRCSYCGSLTHIVQFCPKTYAGRSNIESRERVKRLVNNTSVE